MKTKQRGAGRKQKAKKMSEFDTYDAEGYCEYMANAINNHSAAEMQDAVDHLNDHNTNGETEIDRDVLNGLAAIGQAILNAKLIG